MDDHYAVLGVSEDATPEEISVAWRRLVFIHHPDRNPDNIAEAHRQTVAINIAYEILTNDRDRSRFDDVRKQASERTQKTWNETKQRAYEDAQKQYQNSEDQARERVRKWFYDQLGVRPTKRHRCYAVQGNGTSLDGLVGAISERLGDKVWEFRIKSAPVSGDRVAYRVRVVCDPTKCAFREHHSDWVLDYYYGLFKPGTPEDASHNERQVLAWLEDILNERTYSYRINVFFGVVGETLAPWRCYLDLSVVLVISAFDAFFHANVPGLTKFARENRAAVAAIFNELANKAGLRPADLCRSHTMRRNLARQAENALREERGMKIQREWVSVTT